MKVRVKSGEQVVSNRAGWAITYLNKAEAIERVKRGYYQITERGRTLLNKYGKDLRKVHLEEFESFIAFQNISSEDKNEKHLDTYSSEEVTPEEQVERAINLLQKELAEELINEILDMSPYFFEKLVLDLLFHMGYGGKNRDSFIHTQYGHDGGIDGLIKEDELGLDYIYIQAKRWKIQSLLQKSKNFPVHFTDRVLIKEFLSLPHPSVRGRLIMPNAIFLIGLY